MNCENQRAVCGRDSSEKPGRKEERLTEDLKRIARPAAHPFDKLRIKLSESRIYRITQMARIEEKQQIYGGILV